MISKVSQCYGEDMSDQQRRWRTTATGNTEQWGFSEVQPAFHLEDLPLKEQGPNSRARAGRARAKRKTEVLKGHWKTMETKAEARHALSLQGGGRTTHHSWDTNMKCAVIHPTKAKLRGQVG